MNIGKSGAYIAPKIVWFPRNKKLYGVSSGFWLHRNWAEYLKIIWRNILPRQGIGWVIGCGTCQIPDNGSRPGQIQVLQKTGMNLCWPCDRYILILKESEAGS